MANLALRGVPNSMYQTLKEAAKRNHRSLNGEILTRLEASLRPAVADAEVILGRVEARAPRLRVPPLDDCLLGELKDTGRE
jgi:hypothetical protein